MAGAGREFAPVPIPAKPGSSRAWGGWHSRTPSPVPTPRRRRSWRARMTAARRPRLCRTTAARSTSTSAPNSTAVTRSSGRDSPTVGSTASRCRSMARRSPGKTISTARDATTGYIGKGRFELVNLAMLKRGDGIDSRTPSIVNGVTRCSAAKTVHGHPARSTRTTTTSSPRRASRRTACLWRLRFDDIEHPENARTVEILLRGDEGHRMLDNVTIDRLGRIVMDEDPGNDNRVAKIWLYAIETREFIQVAAHNPRSSTPTPRTRSSSPSTRNPRDHRRRPHPRRRLVPGRCPVAQVEQRSGAGRGRAAAGAVDRSRHRPQRVEKNRHDDNHGRRW